MNNEHNIRRKKLPSMDELRSSLRTFSFKEWLVFGILGTLLIGSTIAILAILNSKLLIEIPKEGGSFTEGIVGTPRFVNPVLATSDADKDLVSLVYSGLMKKDSSGNLVTDLANEYEISEDGLSYTFTLSADAKFHDGKQVTSDDIIFTIEKIKDPLIKSPRSVAWQGVTVEKIDEQTVVFKLRQRFSSFLDNTTIGILPSHIWGELSTEEFGLAKENIDATGSGPYEIKDVNQDSSNVPYSFELKSFNDYLPKSPYIKKITVRFFNNEEDLSKAYKNKKVDMAGALSPNIASKLSEDGYEINHTTLPRIFGLFLNKTEQPLFGDINVVKALELAINKQAIIDEILYGYGRAINSPIPINQNISEVDEKNSYSLDGAISILEKNGWKKDEGGIFVNGEKRLSFSITTSDIPEIKSAAQMIQKDLGMLGAEVELKIFEMGTLNQNVIRGRKYDALFFGQIINHPTDLFAFWHSSQRNDPGLNISLYTNPKADKALEDASGTLDIEKQKTLYQTFDKELSSDKPALFMYSPDFVYATSKKIKGLELKTVSEQKDRFADISLWYIETEKIWPVFRSLLQK
jgi:peptide/nickel transport system substrate-binding protein